MGACQSKNTAVACMGIVPMKNDGSENLISPWLVMDAKLPKQKAVVPLIPQRTSSCSSLVSLVTSKLSVIPEEPDDGSLDENNKTWENNDEGRDQEENEVVFYRKSLGTSNEDATNMWTSRSFTPLKDVTPNRQDRERREIAAASKRSMKRVAGLHAVTTKGVIALQQPGSVDQPADIAIDEVLQAGPENKLVSTPDPLFEHESKEKPPLKGILTIKTPKVSNCAEQGPLPGSGFRFIDEENTAPTDEASLSKSLSRLRTQGILSLIATNDIDPDPIDSGLDADSSCPVLGLATTACAAHQQQRLPPASPVAPSSLRLRRNDQRSITMLRVTAAETTFDIDSDCKSTPIKVESSLPPSPSLLLQSTEERWASLQLNHSTLSTATNNYVVKGQYLGFFCNDGNRSSPADQSDDDEAYDEDGDNDPDTDWTCFHDVV
jgi:hypothetical protein